MFEHTRGGEGWVEARTWNEEWLEVAGALLSFSSSLLLSSLELRDPTVYEAYDGPASEFSQVMSPGLIGFNRTCSADQTWATLPMS